MKQFDNWLLGMILAATATAALVVALDSRGDKYRQALGRQFQSLVGGLGLGCRADLSRCSWQFDPRLIGDEDPVLGALAGESSPWHAISLFPATSPVFAGKGE